MRAIVIARTGGPEVLELRDVPVPVPGPRAIRVRVHATAINRADLLQRMGLYPAPEGSPQDIPGIEYAGVVDVIGDDVTRWQPGDRVMGIVGGGSYAEFVIVHEDEAVRVPRSMSLTDAAAVPEAFITAHDALFTRLHLEPDDRLLIHAVGSGVGLAALQLAKQHGAHVIGTQRSAWKLERAMSFGLDDAIDVTTDDFVARAAPVDAIVDLVGGSYLDANLRAIRVLGRIVVVGLVGGSRAELDMRLLLQRRATVIGTVLRARSLPEKVEAARLFERDVVPLLESGVVRPVVDDVIPLEDAARAHEIMAANTNFGRIVLAVADLDRSMPAT